MKAYSYDQDGYFIEEYECQKSPLEDDVYLIPGNATADEPKRNLEEGFENKWDGKKWSVEKSRARLKQERDDVAGAAQEETEVKSMDRQLALQEFLDSPLDTLTSVKNALKHLQDAFRN